MKLKLMIVDDEPAIRQGIATCIDWKAHDIDLVAEAGDGFEALDVARRAGPDLVIADVRMPRMNGLEFAKELQKYRPECRVLFMSGFADFEYARQAISVGAIDYLLKPYGAEELLEKVVSTGAIIEREREARLDHLAPRSAIDRMRQIKGLILGGLISGKYSSLGEFENEVRQADVQIHNNQCRVMVFEIDREMAQSREYDSGRTIEEKIEIVFSILESVFESQFNKNCLFSVDGKRIIGLVESSVLSGRNLVDMGLKVIRRVGEEFAFSISVGLGDLCENPVLMNKSLRQALDALKKKAIRGRGLLHVHDAAVPEPKALKGLNPRSASERISELLLSGDSDGVQHYIRNLFTDFSQEQTSFEYARDFLERMSALTIDFIEDLGFSYQQVGISQNQIEEVAYLEFTDDLEAYFVSRFSTIATFLSGKLAKKERHSIVKGIHFIHEHFNEKITLDMISSAVAISPCHFSRLFSAETGQTFLSYLTKYRINRAKEILQVNPEKRMFELAEAVGFGDYKRFAANFKKHVGMSPKEFASKTPR
jgi:two-component system, response regulator YesN